VTDHLSMRAALADVVAQSRVRSGNKRATQPDRARSVEAALRTLNPSPAATTMASPTVCKLGVVGSNPITVVGAARLRPVTSAHVCGEGREQDGSRDEARGDQETPHCDRAAGMTGGGTGQARERSHHGDDSARHTTCRGGTPATFRQICSGSRGRARSWLVRPLGLRRNGRAGPEARHVAVPTGRSRTSPIGRRRRSMSTAPRSCRAGRQHRPEAPSADRPAARR
jgi:hypothetical protein